MSPPKILALAGSTRLGSFNVRLVQAAAAAARQAGAEVTWLDLSRYPLPLFNQDLEQDPGTPAEAKQLKQLFVAHDGLLVAAPEYNGSITPLLKNTIDWVSRPAEGEPSLVAYRDKVAALLSASPGAMGGLRGLVHVRAILSNIGVLVLPDQLAVGRAAEALGDDGRLSDAAMQSRLEGIAGQLVQTISRLRG